MSKKRRSDRHDEPSLPEEGWYDCACDSLWIVGHTEAGFPYGPTRSEVLDSLELTSA